VFFVLMAIPWDAFQKEDPTVLTALVPQLEEEIFEDEIEPLDDVEEPVDDLVEPQLQDEWVPDEPTLEPEDTNPSTDVNFLDPDVGDPVFDVRIGLGDGGLPGGGGGKYGGRGRPRGGGGTEKSVKAGLDWLAMHQSGDGSWDADGFDAECGKIGASRCDGAGHATHDVGLTGLALLAFLGHGNTTSGGSYRDTVVRAVLWLRKQQDPDTGLFGGDVGHDFLYDHALATLAICETYYYSQSPLLRNCAQSAVNLIQRARNPYGAWRYDMPPIGDSDTSVTGWMIFALVAAKDAGLVVDQGALDGGLAWIDEVTEPATGRVGYAQFGSLSSRTPANEHYPREKGEAMTAVGLLCRTFVGQKPADTPIMDRHAELLARTLPVWDPDGHGCDMYYWYYGSYALFQLGGAQWKKWERAMQGAVIDSQRKDGDAAGSWDPVGPWGHAGGRVYSTALMTLCLEVRYRYGRVLGAR